MEPLHIAYLALDRRASNNPGADIDFETFVRVCANASTVDFDEICAVSDAFRDELLVNRETDMLNKRQFVRRRPENATSPTAVADLGGSFYRLDAMVSNFPDRRADRYSLNLTTESKFLDGVPSMVKKGEKYFVLKARNRIREKKNAIIVPPNKGDDKPQLYLLSNALIYYNQSKFGDNEHRLLRHFSQMRFVDRMNVAFLSLERSESSKDALSKSAKSGSVAPASESSSTTKPLAIIPMGINPENEKKVEELSVVEEEDDDSASKTSIERFNIVKLSETLFYVKTTIAGASDVLESYIISPDAKSKNVESSVDGDDDDDDDDGDKKASGTFQLSPSIKINVTVFDDTAKLPIDSSELVKYCVAISWNELDSESGTGDAAFIIDTKSSSSSEAYNNAISYIMAKNTGIRVSRLILPFPDGASNVDDATAQYGKHTDKSTETDFVVLDALYHDNAAFKRANELGNDPKTTWWIKKS